MVIIVFLIAGAFGLAVVSLFGALRQPIQALDSLTVPTVAVLEVEGEIFDTRWAVSALRDYSRNDNVKSVVLRINSPGGAVAPCQELYDALEEFDKPVVVSLGSVAASGGLYLAVAGGHHIMANRGTLTGSIGVIMETLQFTGAMEKIGVGAEVVTSGPDKDIGSPFRPMRPEERALIQAMVDGVYEQFVLDVAVGRPGLAEAEVRAMADGRIFTGEAALAMGLIDSLGGFQDALEMAMELGGIDLDADPPVIYENGRGHWIKELLGAKLKLPGPLGQADNSSPALKFLYRPGLF